jgi:hypothetical protein
VHLCSIVSHLSADFPPPAADEVDEASQKKKGSCRRNRKKKTAAVKRETPQKTSASAPHIEANETDEQPWMSPESSHANCSLDDSRIQISQVRRQSISKKNAKGETPLQVAVIKVGGHFSVC